MKLQHFGTTGDALDFIKSEILSTMETDLERMTSWESQHYDDESRDAMRAKIADIKAILPFVTLSEIKES